MGMIVLMPTEQSPDTWNWTRSAQLEDGTRIHILRLKNEPAEIVLAEAWLAFLKTNMIRTIWHGQKMTLRALIDWAMVKNVDGSDHNVVLGCFVQDKTGLHVAGLGFITTITKIGWSAPALYKSEVGFGFLPFVHRTRLPVEFAEMMIDWGFETLNLAAMYGTTPTPNVLACRFAKRLGFSIIGVAPLYGSWTNEDGTIVPCDCQIEVMTREQWFASSKALEAELVEV